jgi:hypothetical protein
MAIATGRFLGSVAHRREHRHFSPLRALESQDVVGIR